MGGSVFLLSRPIFSNSSHLVGLVDHDAPDDGPNPATERKEELEDAEDESHAVEFLADASGDHRADAGGEGDAKDDLGRSVEPRLDVGVDFLVLEAARAKINDLDAGLINFPQQNILRFQIAMDDVVFAHVVERYQNLDREALNQTEREAQEVVHLDEVV